MLRAANATYFPPKLVDAMFDRERLTRDKYKFDGCVWCGVDPAGHSVSDMGLCAVGFISGTAVVIGAASVNVARSDVAHVQAMLKVFLRRLRKLIPPETALCPVIEVNGSEVYAASLCATFNEFAPIYLPWTKEKYAVCVLDGIGVRTTHETKMQQVQHAYLALVEGRAVIGTTIAHVSKADTTPKAQAISPEAHLEELAAQLKRFADTDKGEITGKNEGGDNDDIGMAFLLALYWSACARAAEGLKGHV